MVVFTDRSAMDASPPAVSHVPQLKLETYALVCDAASGWDVRCLESEWREWIVEPPRDVDAGAY